MTNPDPDLRARFLAGMSHLAATVNVVTTDGAAGRGGITVSAMSSVSADTPKPTLLVCAHREGSAAPIILENQVFCVNVLRDDQAYISDAFAGRFRDQLSDKFDCAEWVPMMTGAPRVVDPLVAFDCRVVSSELVGTHHVFFGEVQDIYMASHGSPLIYARRAYGAASRIETPASIGAGRAREANHLRLACFYTISAFTLPGLLRRLVDEAPEAEVTLTEGDQSRIAGALLSGEAEIALMYGDSVLPDGLESEMLVARKPYVLLQEDHPLAAQDTIAAADLADLPMVLLSTPPSPDYFLSLLRKEGVEPKIAWQSGVIETVRGMVAAGLGYAILASRPVSEVSYEGLGLVTRPLAWEAPASRLVLVRRVGQALSPMADRFARLCRHAFGVDPS
ncbi:MAG: LysR substrate-binding domain-containing protein [Pseudomonadota bacterium]